MKRRSQFVASALSALFGLGFLAFGVVANFNAAENQEVMMTGLKVTLWIGGILLVLSAVLFVFATAKDS